MAGAGHGARGAADSLPSAGGVECGAAAARQGRRVGQRAGGERTGSERALCGACGCGEYALLLAGEGVGRGGQGVCRQRGELVGDGAADARCVARTMDRLRDARGSRGAEGGGDLDSEPGRKSSGRREEGRAALCLSHDDDAGKAGPQGDAVCGRGGHRFSVGEWDAGVEGRPAAGVEADALEEVCKGGRDGESDRRRQPDRY